jgi:hypothetical protein
LANWSLKVEYLYYDLGRVTYEYGRCWQVTNPGEDIARGVLLGLEANNAPKAACAGDRGFETDQKTGAILENSHLNDSSKAARRRPLNRGREKTRIMVGSWRMKAHNWQPSGESRFRN